MIKDFYDNHVFLYIMGGLCVFGVILKCSLLVLYNKLIKASECMTSTKKHWLKNMRLRFESSYQLQLGVNDVDTYVDKYVSRIKCGGLLLSTWENISGQTIGLCLLIGSFAGIIGFINDCGQGPVLFTFFSGAWAAIIVNIVDNIVNISAHKQMLRYNLIDFFENNLKVRMEQELYHSEARRNYQRQNFDDGAYGIHNVKTNGSKLELDKGMEQESNKDLEMKESTLKAQDVLGAQEEILDKKTARKRDKVDEKALRRQEKIEAKAVRKQDKIDAKKRIKQEKIDAKLAKRLNKREIKQEKLDAMQARKQEKIDKKQQIADSKKAKKKEKEERKIAKEKAIIEEMLAKKNERVSEREEKEFQRKQAILKREQLENIRKQKSLENNKAYKEKMRLKEEKEREAARRKEELEMLQKVKEQERKQKEEVALADKMEIDSEEKEFNELEDAKSIAMTSTSKEENILIEEVLKDFLF